MSQLKWWQKTTIYQIYPRSFQDSNYDGIGDLQGVINRLDYLNSLGVETIWLSPFFKSPQQDFGYDISDYRAIASEYGHMELAEKLISEVHKRDMKVVFDMVMNHTSIEHHWFKSSKLPNNDKMDWYIWRKGRKNNSKPPTNWKSMIGGNGWHFDNERKEWYYASFLPFQPDLNYHNPEVKEEMFNTVRFWMKKDVDGFRLDIFNAIYKDDQFRNNPFSLKAIPTEKNADGFFQKTKYTINNPLNFEFAKSLRSVVDELKDKDRFLIGEVFGRNETIKKYLGEQNDGLNLVFHFEMLHYKFNASYFKKLIKKMESLYPFPKIPVYTFCNHDRNRSIERISNDSNKAKLLALFQLTVRGVPVIYQGEEIGMTQMNIPLKKAKDPLAIKYSWIPQFIINLSPTALNRDGCRTPMQWTGEKNGGFCSNNVTPWLPVNSNANEVNVKDQLKDESSLLNCYKQLYDLRRKRVELEEGSIKILEDVPKGVLAYSRSIRGAKEVVEVFINFSKREQQINFTDKRIIYSTNEIAHSFLPELTGIIAISCL